jgi:hypothetical protein
MVKIKHRNVFIALVIFTLLAALPTNEDFGVFELSSMELSDEEFSSAPVKNICSITINSDDELKAFKSNLSGNRQFQFTEFVTNDKNWFEDACQSGVQCDVLIISGHFGGTFFGKTNQHLSLSQLESNSCSQSCKGVLSHPKEIYLFGCNTLSTKDPDSRTPEEYLRALLEDGLERSFAERVVEARYGPSGEENLNRMKRSFPGVPAIYGFCQKAPLGHEAGPIVKRYLGQAKNYYSHLLDLQQVKDTKQPYSAETLKKINNEKLANMFKAVGRCFRQTPGVDTNDDISNKVCSVRNSQNSMSKRAQDLDQLLRTPQNLSYIELCNDFFNEIRKKDLNSTERAAINELKNNLKLREDIENVIKQVSFFLSFEYAALALELGSERSRIVPFVSGQLIKLLKKGVSREELNYLHNLSFRVNFKDLIEVDYNSLENEKIWTNPNSIQLIGLTGTEDKAIHQKIQSLLKTRKFEQTRQILQALINLKAFDESIRDELFNLLYDERTEVRADAVRLLSESVSFHEKTANEVIALMSRETIPQSAFEFTGDQKWLLKKSILYFFYSTHDSPVVKAHLVNSLFHNYFEVRLWSAKALGRLKLYENYQFESLIKCMSQDSDLNVRTDCRWALKNNRERIPIDLVEKIKTEFPQDYVFIF